ncbi:MAG: aminotransferase class V-fold PLP-dependent enzyme [Bacteroidales bacterium]
MEHYFEEFRRKIVGVEQDFRTPYGIRRLIYADWVASGRLYKDIEDRIVKDFGPFVGNSHTEASETGVLMTDAYNYAKYIIKKHCNANENDVLISEGSGMTGVVNKLQRIIGLKTCAAINGKKCLSTIEKPVVFLSHMEHHSNHLSWLETNADVVLLKPDKDLLVNPKQLRKELTKYSSRKIKIGAFTACSNVTGIETPIYELAAIMHEFNGFLIADYAASAPYVPMDMHPSNPKERLDAIIFSPHKFLGGPGTSGICIFNRNLYSKTYPDHPGGGTIEWMSMRGDYKYIGNIESLEDGGTPGILQLIRVALCIKLKEKMTSKRMQQREKELLEMAFKELEDISGLHILAGEHKERLGIISFCIEGIHYNLVVKILNDRFGIQLRGGCACAATYGHYLLGIRSDEADEIIRNIEGGDLVNKIGWVRLSLHPTMTNLELSYILNAIKQLVENKEEWKMDYVYISDSNEYRHKNEVKPFMKLDKEWFHL